MRLIAAQGGWLAAEAMVSAALMAAAVAVSLLGQRLLLGEYGVRLAVALVWGGGLALVLLASGHRLQTNPLLSIALRPAGHGANPASAPGVALRTAAQCTGACAGLVAAQAAFNLDAVQAMAPAGDFWASAAAEIAASAILPAVYLVCGPRKMMAALAAAAALVAICAFGPAYAFGNPAATVARSLSAGVLGLPVEEAALVLALQIVAGACTVWLFTRNGREAPA